jgi:WD40 repeat protein
MSPIRRLLFFVLASTCVALAVTAAPPPEGSWEQRAVLKIPGGSLGHLNFAPDGQTLAVAIGGYDHQQKKQVSCSIQIWDVEKKEVRQTLEVTDKWITGMSFTADGEKLVTAGWDGFLRRWDPATGKELDNTPVADTIRAFWLPADRKSMVISAVWLGNPRPRPDKVEYQIRELATGKQIDTIAPAANFQLLSLAPDGKSFSINARPPDPNVKLPPGASFAQGKAELCLWEIGARKESAPLTSLLVSGGLFAPPEGKLLAVDVFHAATMRRSIGFFDLTTKKLRPEQIPYKNNVEAMVFSEDGKWFACASEDHVIRVWDVARMKEAAMLEGHRYPIVALTFSPDGQTLASVSWDSTVRLWSPKKPPSPGEK